MTQGNCSRSTHKFPSRMYINSQLGEENIHQHGKIRGKSLQLQTTIIFILHIMPAYFPQMSYTQVLQTRRNTPLRCLNAPQGQYEWLIEPPADISLQKDEESTNQFTHCSIISSSSIQSKGIEYKETNTKT